MTLSGVGNAWAQEQSDATWGLARISQRGMVDPGGPWTYRYYGRGEGITVYVVDTGIYTSHTDFGGRATWGFNAIDAQNADGRGHGTHMAALVGGAKYGVAKKVDLVAVKVLGASGSGSVSGIVNGMNWVARTAVPGKSVALLSFHGGRSAAIDGAVKALSDAGVIVVAAAGDEGREVRNASPAGAPEAIAVGATDINDQIASFSNWGRTLALFAPGEGTSAWSGSDTASKTIRGTDVAAAYTAGVAALLLSYGADPAQVREMLIGTATVGLVKGSLRGTPNRMLYKGEL